MKTEWNLDILYTGLDDPNYAKDIESFKAAMAELHSIVTEEGADVKTKAEKILSCEEVIKTLVERLYGYLMLRQSVDAENGEIMAQSATVMRMLASMAGDSSAADKFLGGIENPEELAESSEIIRNNLFVIKQAAKKRSHLLSDAEEVMAAAMDTTGASAWSDLQSFLTSTVKAEYRGETKTLTEVRNLAYSTDERERRDAYFAELASYEKIQDSVAFALNNIKNQVTMLSRKRGYESPLAMTLDDSLMQRSTLDAMMDAIREYLPAFRKYLRKQGELLGYKNGLPWFNLFAPVGTVDQKFSPEEARDYLLECFGEVAPDIAAMMKEAFENEWIDFFPRHGKQGGAFCAGSPLLKQSRILTNFSYDFGSVSTLAHELGHAFHNRQLEGNTPLNIDYAMPIAETASTFNEVLLGAYALKHATSDDERLALLEGDLIEKTQCVVDIYSRYLFETAVFEQCGSKFLMADDLNALMLECQKQAYGDGLDPEYLNKGMWICKSHYYISGLSFYNFPYAFGNLFAQGLYALFCEQGEAFMPRYEKMLRLTSVHTMEENGAEMGIDLSDRNFWAKSLASIAEEIDEFCAIADARL